MGLIRHGRVGLDQEEESRTGIFVDGFTDVEVGR